MNEKAILPGGLRLAHFIGSSLAERRTKMIGSPTNAIIARAATTNSRKMEQRGNSPCLGFPAGHLFLACTIRAAMPTAGL
jgi:hypothetical protein